MLGTTAPKLLSTPFPKHSEGTFVYAVAWSLGMFWNLLLSHEVLGL